MEIKEIYLNSQTHKIISLDKSSGMISHAYMLECADEFILDKYSMYIAKEILCLNSSTPCDECNNCLKIEHSNMVDLKIYPRDNKNIVVEDINEIINDAFVRPVDSNYKIFVLNNFNNATTQAQNKLLKTLEEPPANVVFILTCTNSNAVLQTIYSRVKTINEVVLDIDTATKLLDGFKVKDAGNVASISGGNIGVALNFASKGDAGKLIELAIETLIELRSSADVLRVGSKIVALKKDFPLFLDTLIGVLRDISISGSRELINFKSKEREIIALRNVYTPNALMQISENLNEIYNKLNFNCNLTGIVDQMLLDILEVRFLCQQ